MVTSVLKSKLKGKVKLDCRYNNTHIIRRVEDSNIVVVGSKEYLAEALVCGDISQNWQIQIGDTAQTSSYQITALCSANPITLPIDPPDLIAVESYDLPESYELYQSQKHNFTIFTPAVCFHSTILIPGNIPSFNINEVGLGRAKMDLFSYKNTTHNDLPTDGLVSIDLTWVIYL